ncbi:MAG: CotH kinase family protein [Prevotella sp.]|jgi:hypothetical protein|nr:CotH kinase family protein [Prevotella sp.]
MCKRKNDILAFGIAGAIGLFHTAACFADNTPQVLTGSIIFYDQENNASNAAKAFDGNTATYYTSNGIFGNWLGYDLGSPHVITGADFCPRATNEGAAKQAEYMKRLELGIFEGANQPDFGDAIALAIIPDSPGTGFNTVNFSCSRAFRYVRFIFPYALQSGKSNYMAELKFYGYADAGNDTRFPQLTNLPTVNIHTADNQDITSKEVYIKGIVSIVYDNGTKIYSDSLEIRGRGNNSWTYPKKPYRMKLFNSVKLMGNPAKAKNWTLINNYGDKTLMRNVLAFDFSRRIEMPYTSPITMVDVVLNGDYKGCYQLCDHIDVRSNRVDVEEMSATDLTGGYHIEMDDYAAEEVKYFTSTNYSIPVSIKYPDKDDITPIQEAYIKSHFNKLTDAVYVYSSRNPETNFRNYLDTESFLRHFLVGEYSGNTDTYWSVHLSKKRDEDKFYVGPVWDFDLGFENDNRTYSIIAYANQDNQWLSLSSRSSAAGNAKSMVTRIISDANIQTQLKEIYRRYRDKGVISKEVLQGVIDSCATLLADAQALNFKRWDIMNTRVHQNPKIWGSYAAEVANVRNYAGLRLDWMDKKLDYTPSSVSDNRFADLNIRIRNENNRLYINNLPENSRIKILNLLGVACAGQQHGGELSINLTGGVYLIAVTVGGKTYTCKYLMK